jgi:hypothetical protein
MDLEFQESDFSRLMFPIMKMPDNIDPVKFFPKLQRWQEFYNTKWPIIKKNKVFRYIVLMYDKESPFLYKVNNILKRKVEVAKYVKLVENPKMVTEDVMDMFSGKDQKFNTMVIAYVRMHKDVKYSLVVGLDNLFYSDLEKIQAGLTPKKPIDETQKSLEDAIAGLLSNDDSPQLRTELFTFMEEERLSSFRPEGIAEMIAKGEDVFEGKETKYE